MAEKSILSQLDPRPSFDNSSVEVTIIEPNARCLQSMSSSGYLKHHHRHHNHKRTELKKSEIREDLQKKMKEVKQKISELESKRCQQPVCQSNSITKRQYDIFKRNTVSNNSSETSRVLTRSVSEGELLLKIKKRADCQKLHLSRKSIICQACALRFSQQEELLKFISAQHQQVLDMMHEIKADLQIIKNDRGQEYMHKGISESVGVLENNASVVNESLPVIDQTICQQQQDTSPVECGVQEADISQDSNSASQTSEKVKTENSDTTSYPEKQLKNKLPTIKGKQMQKYSGRKEDVECVDRIGDSLQKCLMKQNRKYSNQNNTDSDANSISSSKCTKISSHEILNAKYNVFQSNILKDPKTLVGQRKLDSKSFIPNMTDKVRDFPQKETLAPLNRLSSTKQYDKNTNTEQSKLTDACDFSRSYELKNDTLPKDNHKRQIKSLKFLRGCHTKQTQHQDKYGINSPASMKEVWKISGDKINIPTVSDTSDVTSAKDGSHRSSGELIDGSESSLTSHTYTKLSSNTNFIKKMDLSTNKETQYRREDSSTSNELETPRASKKQSRKHKLGKLLKTKKNALFGSSGKIPSKPLILTRDSRSSLTFVIDKSKSKSEEDGNIPEIKVPENDIPCQYNVTDAMKTSKQTVSISQYTLTTTASSFAGKCDTQMATDAAPVHDAEALSIGNNLDNILTKKCISYDRITSEHNCNNSSDINSSPSILCNMEQKKDDCALLVNIVETHSNWIACVQEVSSMNKASDLEKLPGNTLVFWDGENFVVGEEALRQMDSLMSACTPQDKKAFLKSMSDIQGHAYSEGRVDAAEKDSVGEHITPEREVSQNVPQKCMEQSYMNPNFNFIPASEACITPRYEDQVSQDKKSSRTATRSDPVGSEDDFHEIELTLSFDDLEYLLLHKIRKYEMKNDLVKVEALRKTLEVVRQCYNDQQELLQDSSETVKSPSAVMSSIRTVIISPRGFHCGQNVHLSTVPNQ